MERVWAVKIVDAVQTVGTKLNSLHEISERIEDDVERKKFRAYLGEVMATISIEILMPIVSEYPDLDPDK